MYDFSKDTRPKISVKDVEVAPGRGRKDFSHVLDLKKDIEENGLIQPVVLTRLPTGKFKLIAGETRQRACLLIPEMAGMVPFTLLEEMSPLKQLEIELSENICRKDLNPFEQIELMAKIDDVKRQLYGTKTQENPDGWSIKETANLAGVDESFAGKQIKLAKKLRARPDIKERVKHMPISVAIRVAGQIEEAERVQAAHDSGTLQLTQELVNTDALAFLKKQPDNSVDLFITDPPFGMEAIDETKPACSISGHESSYLTQLKPDDNSSWGKVLDLLRGVLPELGRVLKPGRHFYIFFNLEFLQPTVDILKEAGLTVLWPVLVWDKGRTTTQFRGYSYQSMYEVILFGLKPPVGEESPRRLIDAAGSILRYSPVHASRKLHVFEKPLDMLAAIIKRSSNFGELICDPFAGSGSTLVAAKQTGRRAIGSELDKEHFLKAQGRLLLEELPSGK